ncbi:MAG: DNA repair protein RadC [Bacteroidales bacterium]|nr:DNA repair protein RadC [Bacteroidales bacterium]
MQTDKLNLKDWSEADRPREKCVAQGLSALTDAELIAILLRSGTRQETVVDLAKRVLSMSDNRLNRLSEWSLRDLQQIHGIGQTKAITLLVAFELGRRVRAERVGEQRKMQSPMDVYEYMLPRNGHLGHEEFWVLYLNQAAALIRADRVSQGGLTMTAVDVRLILKQALELSATGLILCHNHPSGDVAPSRHDDQLTRQLRDAAQLLNIQVTDHVVISRDSYYSYQQEGRM